MRGTLLLMVGLCLTAPAGRLRAQDATVPRPERLASPASSAVLATDPRLLASIQRIVDRSPTFREGLDRVGGLGHHVVVLTPGQLHRNVSESANRSGFDDSQIAESVFIPEADSVIRTVVVVLNLALLDRVRSALHMRDEELDDDIDRILIHEVYAHAVPLLTEGRSAVCADPGPGDRAEDSCSIRRENTIRAEAALGRRTDYGLASLTIGQRLHR